jgi:hypothetical protein
VGGSGFFLGFYASFGLMIGSGCFILDLEPFDGFFPLNDPDPVY